MNLSGIDLAVKFTPLMLQYQKPEKAYKIGDTSFSTVFQKRENPSIYQQNWFNLFSIHAHVSTESLWTTICCFPCYFMLGSFQDMDIASSVSRKHGKLEMSLGIFATFTHHHHQSKMSEHFLIVAAAAGSDFDQLYNKTYMIKFLFCFSFEFSDFVI